MNEGKTVDALKTEAEIAKLMAEAGKMNAERDAAVAKLIAETLKLNREARWYPIVSLTALTASIVALIHVFHP